MPFRFEWWQLVYHQAPLKLTAQLDDHESLSLSLVEKGAPRWVDKESPAVPANKTHEKCLTIYLLWYASWRRNFLSLWKLHAKSNIGCSQSSYRFFCKKCMEKHIILKEITLKSLKSTSMKIFAPPQNLMQRIFHILATSSTSFDKTIRFRWVH